MRQGRFWQTIGKQPTKRNHSQHQPPPPAPRTNRPHSRTIPTDHPQPPPLRRPFVMSRSPVQIRREAPLEQQGPQRVCGPCSFLLWQTLGKLPASLYVRTSSLAGCDRGSGCEFRNISHRAHTRKAAKPLHNCGPTIPTFNDGRFRRVNSAG